MEIKAIVKLNVEKVNSISDVKPDDRLFYELGYNKVIERYTDRNGKLHVKKEWIKEGIFQEIENVNDYIKNDEFLNNEEYINHHNFVVLR